MPLVTNCESDDDFLDFAGGDEIRKVQVKRRHSYGSTGVFRDVEFSDDEEDCHVPNSAESRSGLATRNKVDSVDFGVAARRHSMSSNCPMGSRSVSDPNLQAKTLMQEVEAEEAAEERLEMQGRCADVKYHIPKIIGHSHIDNRPTDSASVGSARSRGPPISNPRYHVGQGPFIVSGGAAGKGASGQSISDKAVSRIPDTSTGGTFQSTMIKRKSVERKRRTLTEAPAELPGVLDRHRQGMSVDILISTPIDCDYDGESKGRSSKKSSKRDHRRGKSEESSRTSSRRKSKGKDRSTSSTDKSVKSKSKGKSKTKSKSRSKSMNTIGTQTDAGIGESGSEEAAVNEELSQLVFEVGQLNSQLAEMAEANLAKDVRLKDMESKQDLEMVDLKFQYAEVQSQLQESQLRVRQVTRELDGAKAARKAAEAEAIDLRRQLEEMRYNARREELQNQMKGTSSRNLNFTNSSRRDSDTLHSSTGKFGESRGGSVCSESVATRSSSIGMISCALDVMHVSIDDEEPQQQQQNNKVQSAGDGQTEGPLKRDMAQMAIVIGLMNNRGDGSGHDSGSLNNNDNDVNDDDCNTTMLEERVPDDDPFATVYNESGSCDRNEDDNIDSSQSEEVNKSSSSYGILRMFGE